MLRSADYNRAITLLLVERLTRREIAARLGLPYAAVCRALRGQPQTKPRFRVSQAH